MGTVELENFTELSMKWVQAPSNITTTTKNWGTFLYKEIGSVNDDFYILLPDHASCSSFRSVVHPVAPGVCGAPAICGRCVRRCTTPSRSVWFARARAKVWGGEVGVWIVCSWAPSTSGKGVGSPSGTRVAQIDHHTSSSTIPSQDLLGAGNFMGAIRWLLFTQKLRLCQSGRWCWYWWLPRPNSSHPSESKSDERPFILGLVNG